MKALGAQSKKGKTTTSSPSKFGVKGGGGNETLVSQGMSQEFSWPVKGRGLSKEKGAGEAEKEISFEGSGRSGGETKKRSTKK